MRTMRGTRRAAVLTAGLLLCWVPSDAAAQSRGPTFYEDALPILQQNCQMCHQPSGMNLGGMVAPFSLLTYEDAAPRAARLAAAVASGRMPPWSASAMQR